jgi:hypothetical protein
MKLFSLILILAFLLGTSAEDCGRQARGAKCKTNQCCSRFGWCGNTPAHCGNGCQSHCGGTIPTTTTLSPTASNDDVSSIISSALFDRMLKYRNDPRCKGNGFYAYNAFITAARSFNGFGTSGDATSRKRELAAFLAQTSHETTG